MPTFSLLTFLFLSTFVYKVDCFIDGMYCGRENCYEVLGVNRDSPVKDIAKIYRKLARKFHPDKHRKKTEKEQEEAEERFRAIATAYEVLRDEESRNDYNYLLDNPEAYYSHYYRYYRRQVAPKLDVRKVIAVTITIISIIQYWSAWNNYKTAIMYFTKEPKYRLQAMEIARRDGMLETNKKKLRGLSKEQLREQEDSVLQKVVAEKMDIRGSYSKPSVKDILWIQLLFLPWHIILYLIWYLKWLWKFSICREDYTDTEKTYLIRKKMGLSQGKWDMLEDHEKMDYLAQELWLSENFEIWKKEKEEETKLKLADNNRYKQYKRYMKRGGAGQMTFGPD